MTPTKTMVGSEATVEERKRIAIEFLKAAASGKAVAAAKDVFAPNAKHHNVHFPAGMAALVKAMEADHKEAPNKRFEPVNVVAEGDLIVVHSHLTRKAGQEMAVVHIFRFEGDKVAEFWDLGQVLPEKSPNKDGAF